jgi:tRNA threonylcarbamoyladenosine biosynthesis protein TsaE
LDFYRLDKHEILAMGVQDYLAGAGEIESGVTLIEWAERLKEIWPGERLEIRINIPKNPTERKISFLARGDHFSRVIRRLKKSAGAA